MKTKTVYEIILCNNIIYKLYEQQIKYDVKIGYKLFKLKKSLDEIEDYMKERWKLLFGDDYNFETFTQEEINAYNATLLVELDVDTNELTIDDIVTGKEVLLTLTEIERLDNFLK